ncbi:T9SS type A sorting domain-containing protein [Flavobacterium sp.]|uniref:RCC1 domain-containing protein n=1 Tax=Flavobacterium sp. TaxID=239 RepID=UPI0039E42131
MKKKFTLLLLQISLMSYSQCWQSLSAGYGFTLGIKPDGTLWGCGENLDGELGDGTFERKYVFVQIGTDNDWQQISCGGFHTLALKTNGTLWAWGANEAGQLGDGTPVPSGIPSQVGSENDWAKISAGTSMSAAIKTNGTLWMWGANYYGQLGDGTETNKYQPTQVSNETDWKSITCAYNKSFGIKNDGKLWAWGENFMGGLGIGYFPFEVTSPILVEGENWESISCGANHTLAQKEDGTLWGWGYNDTGAIGDNTTDPRPTPVPISGTWLSYSASFVSSLGIKDDGKLYTWGSDQSGQLGDGVADEPPMSPTVISADTDWQMVVGGGEHEFAFKNNGDLWGFGWNFYGQLGQTDLVNIVYSPIVIDCPMALKTAEFGFQNRFAIYPNPTAGELNIKSHSNLDIDVLVVYDFRGMQIFKTNHTEKIDVSDLPTGIYILKIMAQGNVSYQKFIKK